MRKTLIYFIGCLLLTLFFTCQAHAHTPLLTVDDNEDGTIYLEGGFSTGSSAAGSKILLKDKSGKILWQGKLDESGCIEALKKPAVPYLVILDAGPGHVVEKEGPPLTAAEGGGKEEKPAPKVKAKVKPKPDPKPVPKPEPKAKKEVIEEPVVKESAPAVKEPVTTETPEWTPGVTHPEPPSQSISIATIAMTAAMISLLTIVSFFCGWTVGRRSGKE